MRLQSAPSVQAACAYYVDDMVGCVTHGSLSSDANMLAFSTESSAIHLYRLNDDERSAHKASAAAATTSTATTTTTAIPANSDGFVELVGGHSGAIFKAKFTHDSRYLLSCGDDGLACLWTLSNHHRRRLTHTSETSSSPPPPPPTCIYSGHLYPVWDVEVFSRLNLFATCSKDGTARLWSFDRMCPLRVYCGHQCDVNALAFHPNGCYLASASSDKTVRMWNVQTSEFVRLFSGHRSRVFAVAFSPDGNYLASAGEDRKVKVWDLRSGLMYKELRSHTDVVHALAFDSDSQVLASGGMDRTVRLWDVHGKGIKCESMAIDANGGASEREIQPASSVKQSSTSPAELIRTVQTGFGVFSISCDEQNVFSFVGARKPVFAKNNTCKSKDLTN